MAIGLAIIAAVAGADTLDLLWPSPLLKLIDPIAQSNNNALKKLILKASKTQPSVQKTNLGGWQSDIDFLERPEPAISLLRTRAYHAAFRYLQAMAPPGSEGKYEVSIGSAWANVNNQTHSNSPHMHPGVQVSAVYYVDDGGSAEDGIRFIDPRPQASMIPTPGKWTQGTGEHIKVRSVPGLFVLFPAWLQHYVVPHQGNRSRMSVSFNIRLTFPEDGGDEPTFIGSGGDSGNVDSDSSAPRAPRLTFTVPAHHQQGFLDANQAKDMIVK